MNMSPTDAAQDVAENALSVLEQGFDLSYLADIPGLTELGDDEDGRLYFALGNLPLMIDCDEEAARIQWAGTSAEACFAGFVAVLSAFDADVRRNTNEQGGHFSGSITIGGRAYAFSLFDDQVALGSDGELADGTVFTLADEEGEWIESFGVGRRARA